MEPNFLTTADTPEDLQPLRGVLASFEREKRIQLSLRLWRRIEAFLDEMLLDIGNTVLRQPTVSPSRVASQMLDDYQRKLSAVLKG